MIIRHARPGHIIEHNTFIHDQSSQWSDQNGIDSALFQRYPCVKRGLRNANGEKVPAEGKLYYRGIDVEDLVNNCLAENRFGYEETSYLLLFGHLPNKEQLDAYTKLLGKKRRLPEGFARDMILTAPSKHYE